MDEKNRTKKTAKDKEGALMILEESGLNIIAPPSRRAMTQDEFLETLRLRNRQFDHTVLAYDSDEDRIADERISAWIEQ